MMGVTSIPTALMMAVIVIPPGGLWGPVPGAGPAFLAAAAALPLAGAPRSTSDMSTVNPAATLAADDFDVAIASSSADAAKGNAAPHVHPPAPAEAPAAAAVYTCPMHPEVVSAEPGTCPKCGMTLVKK